MSDMTELLAKVEAATGPDRILDATVAADVAALCLHGSWHSEGPDGDRGRVCDDCGADSWGNRGKFGQRLNDPVPTYTASIDAALALVERMLPGWAWKLVKEEGRFFFVLRNAARLENVAPAWVQSGESAPLVILAALLRALIAQQSGDGK